MVRSRGRRRRRREGRAAEAGAVSEAGGGDVGAAHGQSSRGGAWAEQQSPEQVSKRAEQGQDPGAEQVQEPAAELGAAK